MTGVAEIVLALVPIASEAAKLGRRVQKALADMRDAPEEMQNFRERLGFFGDILNSLSHAVSRLQKNHPTILKRPGVEKSLKRVISMTRERQMSFRKDLRLIQKYRHDLQQKPRLSRFTIHWKWIWKQKEQLQKHAMDLDVIGHRISLTLSTATLHEFISIIEELQMKGEPVPNEHIESIKSLKTQNKRLQDDCYRLQQRYEQFIAQNFPNEMSIQLSEDREILVTEAQKARKLGRKKLAIISNGPRSPPPSPSLAKPSPSPKDPNDSPPSGLGGLPPARLTSNLSQPVTSTTDARVSSIDTSSLSSGVSVLSLARSQNETAPDDYTCFGALQEDANNAEVPQTEHMWVITDDGSMVREEWRRPRT